MHCPVFGLLILPSLFQLFSTIQAASLRHYHRRSDLEVVRPVSELGWQVPLLSGENLSRGTGGQSERTLTTMLGSYALPYPASDKTLKYLTVARGIMTYECSTGDDQPVYITQKTEIYNVAPLAQNLADEDALHALVSKLCEYDYSALTNSTMSCVGRIYNGFGRTVVDLFGFNIPEFSIETTWTIPSPGGQSLNGVWTHSTNTDHEWEVYRVETAGGVTPTSCRGHENSSIAVVYAAEYWFYHR